MCMPKPPIKQLDKLVVLFSLLILGAALYSIYDYYLSSSRKDTVQTLDNALLLTRNLLEEEKSRALSLSVMLSQDQSIINAYLHHDRAHLNDIIQKKIRLEAQHGYAFDIQIHDPQIRTYLRSWDYNVTDLPLTSFRNGIIQVKETRKSLVSVEVGQRLNIKAISPIIVQGRYVGSIEVIENFSHLERKLADEGYTLFILLDKRYLDIATTLRGHPVLQNRYVLVNAGAETNAQNALRGSNLYRLGCYGYFSNESTAFGYLQIINLNNEVIGYFVIAAEQPSMTTLKSYHEKGFEDANDSQEVIIR
jgi:hypothetical protein